MREQPVVARSMKLFSSLGGLKYGVAYSITIIKPKNLIFFAGPAWSSLQRRISRYNVAVMSEHEKKDGNKKLFELSEREKSGALYIMGVVILIFSIVFLASLTNIVLHP